MDTSKIKKGLGRGLSSLIGETKTEKNTSKVLISDLIRNSTNYSQKIRTTKK
jgi:ParB family chromosome partitioning protein